MVTVDLIRDGDDLWNRNPRRRGRRAGAGHGTLQDVAESGRRRARDVPTGDREGLGRRSGGHRPVGHAQSRPGDRPPGGRRVPGAVEDVSPSPVNGAPGTRTCGPERGASDAPVAPVDLPT